MTLVCPACGESSPEQAAACPRCGLATGLFDPVRIAAGVPRSDPQYLEHLADILDAVEGGVGGDAAPSESAGDRSGRLSSAIRFPSTPAWGGVPSNRVVPAAPRLPELPALPPAGPVARLRVDIEEFLRLGRRQGLDLRGFTERTRAAIVGEDRPSLDALRRELFVHVGAALTEEYELLAGRRNELAELGASIPATVDFEDARAALARGDLAAAQLGLRRLSDEISALEEHWATAQILLAEADLLTETIRELHTDPAPALGPLEEGRRLIGTGEREEAERLLARATLALWHLLSGPFALRLAEMRDRIASLRAAGVEVGPILVDVRELADALRRRNFGAGVAAYRRVRDALGREETRATAPLLPGAPVD